MSRNALLAILLLLGAAACTLFIPAEVKHYFYVSVVPGLVIIGLYWFVVVVYCGRGKEVTKEGDHYHPRYEEMKLIPDFRLSFP